MGVITNVSYAHIKNFKNIKQIALAKAEIIENIKEGGSLVLNADDQFYNLHRKMAFKKKLKVYSFGIKKTNSDIKLDYVKKIGEKFKIGININNKKKIFFNFF